MIGSAPDWDWEMIAVLVQILGIAVVILSLRSVGRQIRLQRASHIIESMESLVATWNSENSLKIRRQVSHKMLDDPSYFGSDTEEILEIFERIGMYERIGALPLEAIWEAFSWYIGHYFTLTREGVEQLRDYHDDHLLFENFELLSNKVRIYSKEKEADSELTVDFEKLQKFLKAEIDTAGILLDDTYPSRSQK